LRSIPRAGGAIAGAAGLSFAGMAILQTRSTWETPPEWRALPAAAAEVKTLVPPGSLIVAPEALIYAADRKGCRLETSPEGARRAAGEWGQAWTREESTAARLVEWYRTRGATYFADVGDPAGGRLRGELHDSLRLRYDSVVIDRPGILV